MTRATATIVVALWTALAVAAPVWAQDDPAPSANTAPMPDTLERADLPDAYPWTLRLGGGVVYDPDLEFGWLLHLDATGHVLRRSWLEAGLELEFFGRPERLVSDTTRAISDGTKQIREYETDGGLAAGLIVQFPFAWGDTERTPGAPAEGERPRLTWEVAPLVSGGLFFDDTGTRRTTTTLRPEGDQSIERDEGGGSELAGGYGQIGVRARYWVFEIAATGQVANERRPQVLAWGGVSIPW
ncbi:MAG: hypothetical protein H6684_16145 [Deltaproteobacteria bacterium]|nr:hypothetical protein [Deltaproteobacteria bacterium]MCB9490263.1 hypothetical protein [Deltaproteobacteria bacterium]